MNLKRHHHDAFESLPSVLAFVALIVVFVALLSGCETVQVIEIARRW